MATLNSFQKLSRISSSDYGNGSDGDLIISADTTQSVGNASCSGTATSTSLTLDSASTFANGQIVLIHQTRGTGVGQWEINKISSGGGSTTLTLSTALNYTYTDSGSSQAQVYEVKQYDNITINLTKTWSAGDWGGNTGGILVAAAKGTMTVTGSISTDGKGFRGGSGSGNQNIRGNSGEGTAGASVSQSSSANGNGGGGGADSGVNRDGAGGGYATTGGTGGNSGATGGSVVGSVDLITMNLGGAGGGTSSDSGANTGGDGAGIGIFFSKIITVTGTMTSSGALGGLNATTGRRAGHGSGGSYLFVCDTATLGTNLVTASGGSASPGGAGGDGRICIQYKTSYSGTTTPTINAQQDATLTEGSAGGIFLLTML